MNDKVTETIFEVRFAPRATFLDNRGHLTESLAKKRKLNHWEINNDAIRLFNLNDEY